MDLNEARNLLPLLADDELDAARRHQLAALLERSPELRDELERWRGLRACCGRALCCDGMPAGLPKRIAGQLAPAAPARHRLLRLWPTLAAAAAVLAFAVYFGDDLLRRDAGGSSLGAGVAYAGAIDSSDLVQVYRHCALEHHDAFDLNEHPDRLAFARSEVQRRMGFPAIAVPDLSTAGFELEGCCPCLRHVAKSVKGLKAAHAFYRESAGQQRVVSVFTIAPCVSVAGGSPCRKSRDSADRYEAVTADGDVVVVKWSCKQRTYAIAGRLPPDELRALARRVDAALLLADQPAFAHAGR